MNLPKETFNNLKPDKKDKVMKELKRIFEEKPFQEVTVKEIVDSLGIARGSFYQYFEDLEDAYFTVLNMEVTDIHRLFMTIFHSQKGNLEKALIEYGNRLSEILFSEEAYQIYKNRYLYWNESLDKRWKEENQNQAQIFTRTDKEENIDNEKMHYLKGVVHVIIKRNYQENWSEEEFRKKFEQHIKWLMGGINNGNI